jgi:hypothetical protein
MIGRETLRSLLRSPLYTGAVIATLALTLGATTAIFSIVDGVVLKPLAFGDASRLVAIRETWREFPDVPTLGANEQHFEYWRSRARLFESLAQYIPRAANLTGSGGATQVTVVKTSGSLFDVLQVQARIGRTLTPGDERPDAADVAVVSDGFWRRHLSGDASVAGRAIVLDGRPYTVVGVLAPDFRLPRTEQLTATADAFTVIRLAEDRVGWAGDHNTDAIGRLRGGVSIDDARAELNAL